MSFVESGIFEAKHNTSKIEQKKRDYKKEIIDPVEELRKNFEVKTVGEVVYGLKQYPIFLISSQSINNKLPNIFLSAGIHGNEPAGVCALLDFFKKNATEYKNKVNLFAVPCINPSGFENNTRETQGNVDINRDFFNESPTQETNIIKKLLSDVNQKFVFSCDMHEDPIDDIDPDNPLGYIPEETYLYESNIDRESGIGKSMIKSLEKEGIKFCKASEIYEEPNDSGVVWSPWHAEPTKEDCITLGDYLQRYTTHLFITETTTKLSLEDRKQIQIKMLRFMLNSFCENNKFAIIDN